MRVMIDSNILDRIDEDEEACNELTNRRDIILLVTSAQEREVAAIPDHAKRDRLQGILNLLCRRLSLPSLPVPSTMDLPVAPAGRVVPGKPADEMILAAALAAGCDLLVSDDIEVLNKTLAAGMRAMDWRLFLGRVVWVPRRKPK